MSDGATGGWSGIKRLLSASGIYALASLAQRGVAFFLLPLYTRYIDPSEYGKLEILNVFSSIAFAILLLGLGSSINKCYHRDCDSADEKATVLWTATWLALPILSAGSLALLLLAEPLSRLLVGDASATGLVPLVVGTGFCTSVAALGLSSIRAQERAAAYASITFAQFIIAVVLNITLVVGYDMGITGVLWGNFVSNAVTVPLSLLLARRETAIGFNRRLTRPLLHFGILLIPVMMSGWVMDMSDRYILRLFHSLDEVAVYGVGYKIGMVIQLAVVWPFQLAWPAFSFGISNQPGHQETYARTLTYLSAVLVFAVLGLSLMARLIIPDFVAAGYRDAYLAVPLVALGYAFNGIYYCVSPGIHLAGRTQRLSLLAVGAAVVNLALSLLLIPPLGMMGAAWSTVLAFLALAVATGFVANLAYPVRYEYGRLAKVAGAGLLVYGIAARFPPGVSLGAAIGDVALLMIVFPALLLLSGFLASDEIAALRDALRRFAPTTS